MAAEVMKIEAETECCCICGGGGELLTPEEHDATATPMQVPLRTMLMHLNSNKVVPEGRICSGCATRAADAYEFSNALNARAAPPLSEKIRALRRRLYELTQKIDVFIVVGGPGTDKQGAAAYSEDDIIMVEKDALAAATLADQEDIEHGRNARGDSVYQCSVCPQSFQRLSELRAHVVTHPADSLHCCWTCSAQFPTRAALKEHSAQHAAPAQLVCNLCDAAFSTQTELRRHESNCPSQCPVCNIVVSSRSVLSTHASEAHGRTASPPHVCPACFLTVPTVDQYSAHLLKHRQAKQFVCGYGDCVLRFGTRGNLMAHIRKVHAADLPAPAAEPEPQTQPPHRCAVCDRTFASAAALKRHNKVHVTQPPEEKQEVVEMETEVEGYVGESGETELAVQYIYGDGTELEEGEGEVEYLEVEALEDVEYVYEEDVEDSKPDLQTMQ